MKKKWLICLLILFILMSIRFVYRHQSEPDTYNSSPSYMQSIEINDVAFTMDQTVTQDSGMDGEMRLRFLSNTEFGKLSVNASDGWVVNSIKYYTSDNNEVRLDDDGFINNYYSESKQTTDVENGTEITYGKCYTRVYVILSNSEKDRDAMFDILIQPYDEITINFSQMVADQTSITVDYKYGENKKIITEQVTLKYSETGAADDTAIFMNLDDLLSDMTSLGLLWDEGALEDNKKANWVSEDSGDFVIKIPRDSVISNFTINN